MRFKQSTLTATDGTEATRPRIDTRRWPDAAFARWASRAFALEAGAFESPKLGVTLSPRKETNNDLKR
jgi:hypothetical protein